MIQIGREKFSEQNMAHCDALRWDPSGIGGHFFAPLKQILQEQKIAIWEMAPRMVLKLDEIDPRVFVFQFLRGCRILWKVRGCKMLKSNYANGCDSANQHNLEC